MNDGKHVGTTSKSADVLHNTVTDETIKEILMIEQEQAEGTTIICGE